MLDDSGELFAVHVVEEEVETVIELVNLLRLDHMLAINKL